MTSVEQLEMSHGLGQLPPRVLADVLIDGELKTETLQRHLKRTTRTGILWLAAAAFLAVHLATMIAQGEILLLLIGQAGILAGIGMALSDLRGQRALLARLLRSTQEGGSGA